MHDSLNFPLWTPLFLLAFVISTCLLFSLDERSSGRINLSIPTPITIRSKQTSSEELQEYYIQHHPLNQHVVLPSNSTSSSHSIADGAGGGIPSLFENENVSENREGIVSSSGQPRARRKLAEAEQYDERIVQVVPDDVMWKTVVKSVLKRERSLVGIYALHVSKSGGTSLCDLMKAEKCFHPPDRKGKSNCWAKKYESNSIDLGTQWVRQNYDDKGILNFQLPLWMLYDEENAPSSSCSDIHDYLSRYKHSLAMSENWLPKTGVCTKDFLNIIIFRHPMDRLLSHYRHIYKKCKERSSPMACSKMLVDSGEYFDIDFMKKTFDIVTDNYYTRSLNVQSVYSLPSILPEHHLENAKGNLRNFDWVLLLGMDYENSTQEILQEGVGVSLPLPTSRQVDSSEKKIRFRPQDIQRLEKLNKLDFQLWEESKRLHNLDLISIRRMRSASPHEWYNRLNFKEKNSTRPGCCGVVCDNHYERY